MEPPHSSHSNHSSLSAIYVAVDGSIKAVCDDNTILILSAGAETFTHVSGSTGAKTVQLSDCCISRFAPLLNQVLEFRNQHVDEPALPQGLQAQLTAGGALFSLGWPITDLCWPQSPEEAFALGLVELPDRNRIAVRSRCNSARIVLEFTGLRFAVRYPLLLQHEPGSSSYTYIWQTQVFSRSQFPPRWQPALAVACAVADNAAAGFTLQHIDHQQQQGAVLADVSNRPTSSRQQLCTPQSPAATGVGRCSNPKRYGSPLQRQHRAWQEQQQEAAPGSPAAALAAASPTARHQQWVRHSCSPSSPGRSEYLLLQQPSQQQPGSPQAAAASSVAAAAVTQLPISEHVLQSLPSCLRRRCQQDQDEQQPTPAAASRIAAAFSQAFGRGGAGAAAAGAGAGGSWWLQPSLLLPSDQLLQIIWTPDATMLFVHDVEEVEVWLHADDSCLFSHGAGAFVTHLQPAAAAAAWDGKLPPPSPAAAATGEHLSQSQGLSRLLLTASPADALAVHQEEQQQQQQQQEQAACDAAGLIQGLIDGSEMSRVYAASALPEEPVACLAAAGAGGGVRVPLGRVGAQALKFRSTEARVKRCLGSHDDQPSPPAAGAAAAAGLSQLALTPVPREQQQQQHPLLSNDVTEEQDVSGVGRFVATADGRVRVLFADRTILNLSADQRHCSVLLPDGTQRTVLADHPLGVEEYAQAALEFAAWSRTTPEQRAAALRMQALVAAELRSSARMAAICEWASSAQLPAGAATAALHQAPADAGVAGASLLEGWWQEGNCAHQGGEAALDDEGDCEGYCPPSEQQAQPAGAGGDASRFSWPGVMPAAGGFGASGGGWSDVDDDGGGGSDIDAAPPGWSSRRAAVADVLEENARLLARLQE